MFELQRLRDKCLIAFEKYAQEAQKTCELVGNLEDNSDLLDRLLAVMEQTNVEDQAQRTYLLLRQQLFNVLADIEAPCILEATVPEEDAGDATQ